MEIGTFIVVKKQGEESVIMGQNGETEEPGCDDENLNCEAKSSIRRRQTSRKTSKTENEKVNNNEHDLHRSTGKPSHICPIVHIVTNPWHLRVL